MRSCLDDYGVELGTGAFMTAYSAVPVLGGMSSFGGASHLLSGHEAKTPFELVSSLALYGAAASNIAGTAALCLGEAQLGLSLLAGSGVVGGVGAALLMDGGSLASRLGLQP